MSAPLSRLRSSSHVQKRLREKRSTNNLFLLLDSVSSFFWSSGHVAQNFSNVVQHLEDTAMDSHGESRMVCFGRVVLWACWASLQSVAQYL